MLRRIEIAVIALVIVVAALSTGAEFLFFLVYLGILVDRRLVCRDPLRAGRPGGRVRARPAACAAGDVLRASYTVRNTSRLPKLWLEVRNPRRCRSSCPAMR